MLQRIIFTEEYCQPQNLYPFTFTRYVQDIRIGILTIREKWEQMLGIPSFDKQYNDYKQSRQSITINTSLKGSSLLVNSNLLPTPALVTEINNLKDGELLYHTVAGPVACRFSPAQILAHQNISIINKVVTAAPVIDIHFPWDIFQNNDAALRADFDWLTKNKTSAPLSNTNQLIGSTQQLFIEAGASVECAIINTTTGPVYIGKNALVMEGSIIRGPFALCQNATLKMGAKIYGATTLGPHCTGGGEIKNSVMFGYSNKAHNGYLGDAVVGEWCNMGAGTTNSNLKNNAGMVKLHNIATNAKQNVGIKCGVIMGDYSRSAINTAFNTGTVVGVACNVFCSGLTPAFIPNFSWGVNADEKYRFNKATEHISNWMQLKNMQLSDEQKKVLKYIYDKY
jgi:UDP-N-acetylglucosamine diphosphorylase / glucose-1-phosphate thymidylyltransferase / UDP-N-acetylgalactosamine diphosphorylase / glucosamine-1-phosphate N-acetyltransferase / galactosamine-1-phosphate N-acetyltransferase